MPRYVLGALALWIVFGAGVGEVASARAYRAAWWETVTLAPTGTDLLVSPPIAITTPYLTSMSLHLDGARPPATLQATIVRGSDTVVSDADVRSRSLITLTGGSISEDNRSYAWNADRRQFAPAATCRVVVFGAPADLIPAARSMTIGYDGATPIVKVITFWWPWMLGSWALGLLALAHPRSWTLQQMLIGTARRALAAHTPLLGLLIAGAAIRLVLAMRGGQYFDGDELRYGASATRMFDLLSTGNLHAALDVLLHSPDHPGFRVVSIVPAFFHVVAARYAGYPISEMRYHTGEWLPAFLLSLSSVCSIGLTYRIALRTGGSKREAFVAALLMFSSTSLLLYGRHFLPYDASMALLLFALWIGLGSRDTIVRSVGIGLISGFAFQTYQGYWLTVIAVGLFHMFHNSASIPRRLRRGILFAAGVMTGPVAFIMAGKLEGLHILQAMHDFSSAVTHGGFSQGWRLPWEALWDAEHVLAIVYVVGALLAIRTGRRGVMWPLAALMIYIALGVGSAVLQRWSVYDRLSRQMIPFLCLGAAAGLVQVWPEQRRSWARAALFAVLLIFAVNAWPLLKQRFPREVAAEAIARVGRENIRLQSTLPQAVSDLDGLFLPFGATTGNERYVLVNAKDIWINENSGFASTPFPRGTTLIQTAHPRQLRALQYQGYTDEQRRFLRGVDFSIRLVDTAGK